MPGKRNLARERALHDAPAIQARIFAMLSDALPDHDRTLIGRDRILEHVARLGLRRRNGQPITWRQVRRWRTRYGFPIAHGMWTHRTKTPAVTTQHAVTAWMLSAFSTDEKHWFSVHNPDAVLVDGNAP